jgi:two-component system phosphate regulon sensor histidine kinase PhoR
VKLSHRGRLFAASVAVVLTVVAAAGLYLEHELRTSTIARIEQELEQSARAAIPLLESASEIGAEQGSDEDTARLIAAIDGIADSLGTATNTRITVIDVSGRVLGDSGLTPQEVIAVENHADRPEVAAALRDGRGVSRRHSDTLNDEMTYVAIPFDSNRGRAVLRLAKPDSEVTAAVHRLRLLLLGAGLVAIVLAIALAALASHFMSRALRSLVDSARAIAGGDLRVRPDVEVEAHGELGAMAGSLSKMAEEIQRTVHLLAVERERFETVLEGMTDGVIALDSGARVTLMNPAALRLLGLDEVPRDRPLIETVRSPALQDLVAKAEQDSSVEFEVPGKNARRVMARVAPLRGGGRVLVLHDVTELRRLETVRRDFVANVSHELRTPMSIIRANAETLAGGAMQDEVHGPRLMDAIVRHSERLSALIGDHDEEEPV